MKKLLTLALLLCTTLLSAQTKSITEWQEIDTLIAQGHYTSAYEKGEELLRKAKRKGDSHAILKAVYKGRIAAAGYQEEHIEASVKAYQDIIPTLRGVDKSIAYTLLSVALDDYKNRYQWRNEQAKLTKELSPLTITALLGATIDDLTMWSAERFADAKRLCYEAALAEEKALKATKAEDYDLLVKGDTLGLRLRPTLYDVVMHAIIPSNIYLSNAKIKNLLYSHRNQLYGTAEEFISLQLPSDTLSYELWQLGKLQELTRYHAKNTDAAVRAHIDHRRMKAMGGIQHYSDTEVLQEAYIEGLERIAESYSNAPTEQAMFLFKLADYHKPTIYEHSGKETVERELKKAAKMEQYLKHIRQVAPESEWAKTGEALYKRATHPYLKLESHKSLLPGRESSITITLRNAGSIAYRIVPRHAGETTDNFNYKEVIGRKSVGKAYEIIPPEYPNPYIYKEVELPLPTLDAGDYFVIASNNGKQDEDTKRTSFTAISVSNLKLSMMANDAEGEYIGMVIDATTGKAVTDCEVVLMEKTDKQTHFVEDYSIDAKGYFTVPSPTGNYRDLYLMATDGVSRATYSFRYVDFPGNRYGEDEEASTLFTFLPDRHTYEPGDTIHFALIAYCHDKEGSHVKSQLSIGVTLQDARYKEVASIQGTTDEWGRFNSSFAIPEGITAGRFRLQATDNLSKRTMYHTINVEAFKAPTFKVEMERPKGAVRFGDSLMVQGTATTFTELPVGGAKVKYELQVTDMTIFGRYPLQDAYLAEKSGTTTTDEKGNFCISIKTNCNPMLAENATQNYIITAHITDSSGETQTTKISFVVGHRTKHIEFANPAIFRHGDSIAYSLRTLNGERMTDNVILRLSKLEVPHSNHILTSVERYTDREQWNEEHTYIHRTEQTASDKDSYLLLTKDLPYGFYRLTATYTDGDKQYSEVYHLELWGEGKGTVSSYALYQTRVKSREVQTGDTAVLYVGTRYSEVYLHYYIQIENRVVDKGTRCLTDEMASLRIPIKEEWRGRMKVDLVSAKENVSRIDSWIFSLENRSELLNVQLSSLRNNLEPGEKEQCTIRISDHRGNPVQSSFILSIYDAALDSYGRNCWDIALSSIKYGRRVQMEDIRMWAWDNNTHVNVSYPSEPKYYSLPEGLREDHIFYTLAAPATARGQAKNRAGFDMASAEGLVLEESAVSSEASKISEDSETSEPKTQELYLRKDLRHTALFLPNLRTDEQGQVTFTVTAPDLLTQWHVKGIAHTKDLKHGRVNFDFVTRKTLMVQPHVPRFLYEGDQCEFTAKVTNSGEEPIEAVVKLEIGGRELSQSVSIAPNSSTSVSFPIIAPTGENYLTYRITAESLQYSDGEQATITVLPRRTLVTETMALYVNGKEKREFVFDALKEKHSPTLEHKSLTLELVPNPIWYAIEALPPLCKEENPSNERLFHRYYAATMGAYLIDRYPEVEGYSEFYRRDSLATLCQSLLNRLATNQDTDGGWAWMNGFDSDRYTTLLIIKGLGELEAMHSLNIAQNDTLYTLVKHGIHFLDANYYDSFSRMKRKPKTLDSYALYYLYARSMFPEIPFGNTPSTAYEHYKALLLKDKATQGTLMQKALKMLTLIRLNERDRAAAIAEVVRQSSLKSDEMGIYWRDNRYGWSWDSNPIATQAMLIEAFKRLDQPADIIGRMQQWLLKQKQTTQWSNSVATAQAVYAIMEASPHPLPKRGLPNSTENIELKVKNATLQLIEKDKRGTVKYEVTPEKRVSSIPEIPILLEGEEISSMAWGAMTWQYYEDADKVQASGTGLTLKCTYYKVESRDGKELLTEVPEGSLSKGDRVRVRLHFTADRAMDYVELHLQRPAALEPVSTRSGYTYSNGLGYYRSIENSATKLYFYRIGKGNYIIDGDFWVSQSGEYTSAPSTIQCMYAPEFIATAPAQWIKIK
ncbi:MAG: hypothetical protein IJZ31_04120 [Bacteroidaceae bacterium]|nr:hypothetical protein [Bacteroidaceae bacterium]